jgi:chromosomal replication initiator protein
MESAYTTAKDETSTQSPVFLARQYSSSEGGVLTDMLCPNCSEKIKGSFLPVFRCPHCESRIWRNEDGNVTSFENKHACPECERGSSEEAESQVQPPLDSKYTFDLFANGPGNQFAYAAAMAVADNPAITYNPLFIYGGGTLGKSHLLIAIANKIKATDNATITCCRSAKSIMDEMDNCIKLNKIDEFRDEFSSIDVLLIDGIQCIAGKERAQAEFFNIFNALYEAHKQIVITCDTSPSEMPNLDGRLRSLFEKGLIADIQPPALETKIAILKKKADVNTIQLPDDVAYFIASRDFESIRDLEAILLRLGAHSKRHHIPITLATAKDSLKDIVV